MSPSQQIQHCESFARFTVKLVQAGTDQKINIYPAPKYFAQFPQAVDSVVIPLYVEVLKYILPLSPLDLVSRMVMHLPNQVLKDSLPLKNWVPEDRGSKEGFFRKTVYFYSAPWRSRGRHTC